MTEGRNVRRRQDFWTSLLLIAVSLFFLWRTSAIPFFKAAAAGVEAGHWYNSAAIVPYVIFTALLALAVGLMVTALRQGGAPHGLGEAVAGFLGSAGGRRIIAAALIMLAYIFALVPRVDFTLASALVLLAMIYGFHETRGRATAIATAAVLIPSLYALAFHLPRGEWDAPHDDDWVTLAAFVGLWLVCWIEVRAARGRVEGYIRAAPFIAALVPLFLVLVMAFGFRQNVPNRTGLVFKQIEYHYYVNLRPWIRGEG